MIPALSALVEAGILPLADAEQIGRTLDPEQARLHAEGVLIESFRNGLSLQQRRVLGLLDGTQGQPTARQLSLFWDGENDLLWASVQEDIVSVALENAVRASVSLGDDSLWRLVNESVIEWTEDYYISADADNFGSIPNLNQTAKTIFGNAFNEWQRGELQTAGYRDGLPELIRALEPAFGLNRATRIAATETSRIFAQSELFAARANPFIVYLQWLTSNDELVCPICGPRANRVVGKEDEDGFRVATDDTVGYPPAHVSCRCSITQLTAPALEALRAEGFVNA